MKTYKIMERKYIWIGISLIVISLGFVLMAFRGLNWGIDFTGGNILHFDLNQSYDLARARAILEKLDIKEFEAKKAGDDQQELIIRTVELSKDLQAKVQEALRQEWPETELVRAETIDAVIGKELQRQAIIALIIANIGKIGRAHV